AREYLSGVRPVLPLCEEPVEEGLRRGRQQRRLLPPRDPPDRAELAHGGAGHPAPGPRLDGSGGPRGPRACADVPLHPRVRAQGLRLRVLLHAPGVPARRVERAGLRGG
ncbi:unnamed protein product, partial [Ectocarpus sp. 12 AP-2014]